MCAGSQNRTRIVRSSKCTRKASVPAIPDPVACVKLGEGFIIGSTFRQDGRFLGALEPKRLDAFMRVFRPLREKQA